MKKIFSLKSILVLLVIAGILFLISGINTNNEIKGLSYVIAGTVFIIAGLYLIVRMKDTQ